MFNEDGRRNLIINQQYGIASTLGSNKTVNRMIGRMYLLYRLARKYIDMLFSAILMG